MGARLSEDTPGPENLDSGRKRPRARWPTLGGVGWRLEADVPDRSQEEAPTQETGGGETSLNRPGGGRGAVPLPGSYNPAWDTGMTRTSFRCGGEAPRPEQPSSSPGPASALGLRRVLTCGVSGPVCLVRPQR